MERFGSRCDGNRMRNPFRLTPFEKTLLDLRRESTLPTDTAFFAALGLCRGAHVHLQNAREKARVQREFESTQLKSGFTSLSTAHGNVRMGGTR